MGSRQALGFIVSDDRSLQSEGAASVSEDAGTEARPDEFEVSSVDEEEAAEQEETVVPLGIPSSPETWRELKRRADEPDPVSGKEASDPED
jgi:hypothetical protein